MSKPIKKKSRVNPEEFESLLHVEGLGVQGFGTCYKAVMKDKRLSIESKAIYNYFSSYAGAGRTAFPSVALICDDLCISKNRYYKHFNPLVELGYISTFQMKEDRSFGRNVYILHMNPKRVESPESQEELACLQNRDTDKPQEELACLQNRDTACLHFRDTQIRDTQNEDTNINTININSFNNVFNNSDRVNAPIPSDYYYDWMNDLE